MTRFHYVVAAAVNFVILTAPGASAQRGDFQEMTVGQPVQGSLGATDPRLIDGRPFKVFRFQAQAGRRYIATMESSSFDSYLVLARMSGGITENLKEDDDGGDGVNARLRFTVPSSGRYLLITRGLNADADGPFTVAITDGGEIVTPTPVPVRVGETVEGTLSETDGYLQQGDKNYDLYLVRGAPGEDVHVTLASDAFDAYLEAGELVNGQFQSEESNDDYTGRNAALQLRLGQRGGAVVRATSLGGNQVGAYTLSVLTGKLPPRGVVEGAVVEEVDFAAPVSAPPADN